MLVTSSRNPLLKEIRRAVAKGTLTEDGYCVAESFHLVEEAVRSGCKIGAIVLAESLRSPVEHRFRRLDGAQIVRVPDEVFTQISSTETTQGVLALVRPPVWEVAHVFRGLSLVLILDGIQDPGNAGAIIRTAEAFGVSGVLFLKGTVTPYNPKALRASAGSIFRLPVVAGVDEDVAVAALLQRKVQVFAAMPDADLNLAQVDLARASALVIGSEGRGVRARMRTAAIPLRIPTANVESLNAAVAAAILVYEAWRQRHTHP
jgi:TrmH family RNA methyltransferase